MMVFILVTPNVKVVLVKVAAADFSTASSALFASLRKVVSRFFA